MKTIKKKPTQITDYGYLPIVGPCIKKGVNERWITEMNSGELCIPTNIIEVIHAEGGTKKAGGTLYISLSSNNRHTRHTAYLPAIKFTEDFGPIGIGFQLDSEFAKAYRQSATFDYNKKAKHHHDKHNKGKTYTKHSDYVLKDHITCPITLDTKVVSGNDLWKLDPRSYDVSRHEDAQNASRGARYQVGRSHRRMRDTIGLLHSAMSEYLKELEVSPPDTYVRNAIVEVSPSGMAIVQARRIVDYNLHLISSSVCTSPYDINVSQYHEKPVDIHIDPYDEIQNIVEHPDYDKYVELMRNHAVGNLEYLGTNMMPRTIMAGKSEDEKELEPIGCEIDFYLNRGFMWNPRFESYYVIANNLHKAIGKFAVAIAKNLNSYYNICYTLASNLINSGKHPVYEVKGKDTVLYMIPKVLHKKACDEFYKLIEKRFNIVDIKVVQHDSGAIA